VLETAIMGAIDTIEDRLACVNCDDKGCNYCGPIQA